MPIYEYRCKNGHTLEVLQRMTDDPLSSCTTCAAPVQRVFHPVAVHFKGSGFYNTDYGKQSKGADEAKAKSDEDGAKPKADSDSSTSTSTSTSKGKSGSSSDTKPKASSESKSSG